jgi:hypothetical protein
MSGVIANRPILSIDQRQRRWRDLSSMRLTIGLLLSPAIGVCVAYALLFAVEYVLAPYDYWRMAAEDIEVGAAIVLWWMLFNGAYLLLVTRRLGRIARHECLLVGAAAAFIAPLTLALPWSIIYRAQFIGVGPAVDYMLADMRSNISDTMRFMAILGFAMSLFGLLVGWIFWRISVRPAITRMVDTAHVFE